jgi:hypothetical protein
LLTSVAGGFITIRRIYRGTEANDLVQFNWEN